jgi:2-oxoglutarate dehydrogenase E2 component (dihydrolipoamide succinyltransferase)
MSVDVKVPRLAESISDAVLVEWLREDGAAVRADEPIATLETDKAAVEIAATEPGVLRHARAVGDKVLVGDVLARIEANMGSDLQQASAEATAAITEVVPTPASGNGGSRPAAAEASLSPAVRRLVQEHRLDPAHIAASGKGGRLLKDDVLRHVETTAQAAALAPAALAPAALAPAALAPAALAASVPTSEPVTTGGGTQAAPAETTSGADERVVAMSRIRQRIAERLVQAQHTAAILTTFNEIDMTAVMELRSRHKQGFEAKHGVKLGFMSFFARASVLGLADVPELNAEIRGTDLIYRSRVHLGIAVGTARGLVVPVVRDAHTRSLAGIEKEIERLAGRARTNTLTLDELSGGTFTISNGGVYGSLLSTPILNPPQSGILGMHKIEKRPIAMNDQVVIRPMMYVAVSYDHRIVDGEQAVTFLVRVKERLEDPERMLLEL